jgi:hypothetical protein
MTAYTQDFSDPVVLEVIYKDGRNETLQRYPTLKAAEQGAKHYLGATIVEYVILKEGNKWYVWEKTPTNGTPCPRNTQLPIVYKVGANWRIMSFTSGHEVYDAIETTNTARGINYLVEHAIVNFHTQEKKRVRGR